MNSAPETGTSRRRPRVDVIALRGELGPWPLGRVHACERDDCESLNRALEMALRDLSDDDLVLCWDTRLGAPGVERVMGAADLPGTAWHAGLCLGLGGLPRALDFVHPTWMLIRDPQTTIAASSWRLSLRACLAPAAVWRAHGLLRGGFESLEGASLELGHRWLWAGVLLRHVPELLNETPARTSQPMLSTDDEVRFLRHRVGAKWTAWAMLRAVMTKTWGPVAAARSYWRIVSEGDHPLEAPEGPAATEVEIGTTGPEARSETLREPQLTVLVPTIDRYRYLRVLLSQLTQQTRGPDEVLVIDQTPETRRRRDWHDSFPGLPLRVIELDREGQSTARNAGLREAIGDVILFLDDDDEIPPDLIETHLSGLERYSADGICGVVEEQGAGPIPAEFQTTRLSDVFPTNNGSIRRAALERSGLFDLVYDHGARADADLGLRLFVSGAFLVLDPTVSLFHHRAPRGGLRNLGARKITYASSRKRLLDRHLPSATEAYYALRHFSPRQRRESRLLRIAGTFVVQGSWPRRVAKFLLGLVRLPDSVWRARLASQRARRLAVQYEEIPLLGPRTTESETGQ